ncbi:MAG: hypothetical protein JO035_03040 [Betaproteobacteria bacterium]|nr:hypothetical protein [Betaproteobacteria bacterium]
MKSCILAALCALAWLPLQASGGDFRDLPATETFIFLRIPLDGETSKEQQPVWGFALRGRRDYQSFSVDSQAFSRFVDMGFIESKILVVGAVAGAGALLVGASGAKSAAQNQQQLQQNQAAAAAAPRGPNCPPAPLPPCPH